MYEQLSNLLADYFQSVQTIVTNLEKRLQEVNLMTRKPEEMNNETVEAHRPACSLSA